MADANGNLHSRSLPVGHPTENLHNRSLAVGYHTENLHIRSLPVGYPTENLHNRSLPVGYPHGLVSSYAIDPQSLVSSFSGLSLNSSNHHIQSQVLPSWQAGNFGGPVVDSLTAPNGIPAPPTMELLNGHYSNSMGAQSNFTGGFDGNYMNPNFAGIGNWQAYSLDSNTWVTSQWKNAGNFVNTESELGQNNVLFPSLSAKKQWEDQFNPRSSFVPCSRRISHLNDLNVSPGLCLNGPQSVVRPNPSISRHDHDLNLPLKDLKGKIMSIAKDQSLSRILQDKFESPSEEDVEIVLSEVIDHMADLMTDQYGHHLFQKLIKACNVNHRTRIIITLSRHRFQLVQICCNLLGSRSMQKLLECVSTSEQISIIMSALVPRVFELATHEHGYHVLQQCLQSFPNTDNQLLVQEIAQKCYHIATNRCGCAVLQTCVDECTGELRCLIVAKILAYASHLSEDPFGNYLVQRLLDLKMPQVTSGILQQLTGNFFDFSRSKFASNVVEKCLVEAEPAQSEQIINELLGHPNLSMLLVDPYGNFVIQSAFSVSKGHVRCNMLDMFQAHAPRLRGNHYGKNILQMLEKEKVGVSSRVSNMYY